MRSLACWTSEPKRASLSRRWTSSVSAALSSASETCVASARSALCSGCARRRRRRATTSRPRGVAAQREAQDVGARVAREPERRSLAHRVARAATPPAARPAARRRSRARPASVAGSSAAVGGDDAAAVLDQAQARRGVVADERAHGLERGAVDLVAAGGGHQRRPPRSACARARPSAPAGARGRPCAATTRPKSTTDGADDDEQVEVAAVAAPASASTTGAISDAHGRAAAGAAASGAGRGRAPAARARASTGAAPRRPTAGRS